MAADTVCKFATFRGQRDDKRAPIRFSDLTRNQVPFRQPIQNAGQCRSLMSKATMEFGHFRRPGKMKAESRKRLRRRCRAAYSPRRICPLADRLIVLSFWD